MAKHDLDLLTEFFARHDIEVVFDDVLDDGSFGNIEFNDGEASATLSGFGGVICVSEIIDLV